MKRTIMTIMCAVFTSTSFAYYNSEQGRWMNRDPISENGGVNLYSMAENKTVNYVDPYGWTARNNCCGSSTYDSKTECCKNDTVEKKKPCTSFVVLGHSGSTPPGAPDSPDDRCVLVTCERERTNREYNDNTGQGVPDHNNTRNNGWLFPSIGHFWNRPDEYDRKRGDTSVAKAYSLEIDNAEKEAKQNQCKGCCSKVDIKVYALDSAGSKWMQGQGLKAGDVVKTVNCQ